MFLTVDFNDRRPLYQQVADGVRELIAGGALREGMTLPPVRQVAGDLGVNLNTIAFAYRQLEAEGLVEVRHGSRAVVKARHSQARPESDLRKALRASLTPLLVAGLGEREILRIVKQELAAVQEKGAQS